MKNLILFTLVPIALTLLLYGHKGGIYLAIFIFASSLVGFGQKLFKWRYILFVVTTVILYPLLQVLSSLIRGDGVLSFDYLSNALTSSNNLRMLATIAFSAFSRRLSALDQLNFNSNLVVADFEPITFIFMFLRGVLTAGIVDGFFGHNGHGLGRIFALAVGQDPQISNSYDPTLLGLIIFSPQPLLSALTLISIHFIMLMVLLNAARNLHWGYQAILLYFLFNTSSFLLIGDIQSLGLILRAFCVLTVITFLVRPYRRTSI
jgi:hypothetical protein